MYHHCVDLLCKICGLDSIYEWVLLYLSLSCLITFVAFLPHWLYIFNLLAVWIVALRLVKQSITLSLYILPHVLASPTIHQVLQFFSFSRVDVVGMERWYARWVLNSTVPKFWRILVGFIFGNSASFHAPTVEAKPAYHSPKWGPSKVSSQQFRSSENCVWGFSLLQASQSVAFLA